MIVDKYLVEVAPLTLHYNVSGFFNIQFNHSSAPNLYLLPSSSYYFFSCIASQKSPHNPSALCLILYYITIKVKMAAVMNAKCVPTASSTRSASKARVAFAPSSLRGNVIRALPVRASRQNINTVCKAIVRFYLLMIFWR